MPSSGPMTVIRRVIWALMLREIHTLYGDSRLGYLWTVVQTLFMVLSLWVVRVLFNMHVPHGLSIPEYLLTGYVLWSMMMRIIEKCMTAVAGNRAILTYPQVTVVDIMVARSLVILATDTVTLLLLAVVVNAYGYHYAVENVLQFLGSLLLAAGISLGLGMLMASLSALWPTLQRILPMVWRIFFFISGILYSPARLLPGSRDIVAWNPFLQVIEMSRRSLSETYVDIEPHYGFLVLFLLVTLTLGLLFERYVRDVHQYG